MDSELAFKLNCDENVDECLAFGSDSGQAVDR